MNLIMMILIIFFNTADAGIGDIVGGQSKEVKRLIRSSKLIKGDKILFQKDSSYISVLYNKSLCYDGYEFKAASYRCLKWEKDGDDRVCAKRGKVIITQPSKSFRNRCLVLREDQCEEMEVVDFNQSDIKEVQFFRDESSLLKKQKVKIKDCQ